MHFQPVGSHNVNESVTHLRVVVTEENQSNRWRKEAAPSNHATTWLLLETLSVSTDSVCLLAACRENALETQPWAWPALGYVWPRSADNLDTSQMFSAGDMFPRDVKWARWPIWALSQMSLWAHDILYLLFLHEFSEKSTTSISKYTSKHISKPSELLEQPKCWVRPILPILWLCG